MSRSPSLPPTGDVGTCLFKGEQHSEPLKTGRKRKPR